MNNDILNYSNLLKHDIRVKVGGIPTNIKNCYYNLYT